MGAARSGGLGGGGKSGMTTNVPGPQPAQPAPSGLMNLLGRTATGGQVPMRDQQPDRSRGMEAAPMYAANPQQQPAPAAATPQTSLSNMYGGTSFGSQSAGGLPNLLGQSGPAPAAANEATRTNYLAGVQAMLRPPDRSRGMEAAPNDAARMNYYSSVQSMLRPQAPSNYVGPQPNISPEQNRAMQAGWAQDRERQMREAQLARMRAAQFPQYSFGGYGGGNYGDPRYFGLLEAMGRRR